MVRDKNGILYYDRGWKHKAKTPGEGMLKLGLALISGKKRMLLLINCC